MNTDLNAQIIDEFRANHGQVGGRFEGVRLLLLTTIVPKPQAFRTTPVPYFPDGVRRLIVAADAGTPDCPPWYNDVVAHPQVTVEEGPFILQAKTVILRGTERDRAVARLAEADPGLARQQAKATHAVPVIALEPTDSAPRETMLGRAIKATHDAYRRELALVRNEVAAAGPGIGAQLRINCLTVCQGIHQHHTGEDSSVFPFVGKEYPGLNPLLERLRQDHRKVQRLLDSLENVVTADQSDRAETLHEVDRLIAQLEAHLAYEEAYLLPSLNAVPLKSITR